MVHHDLCRELNTPIEDRENIRILVRIRKITNVKDTNTVSWI